MIRLDKATIIQTINQIDITAPEALSNARILRTKYSSIM
jgi:hypothetical protein